MQKISQSKDVNKPRGRGKGRGGRVTSGTDFEECSCPTQASSATGQLCLFHLSFERERKNCKVYNNTEKKEEAKTKYARYHAVEQKRENKNE